MRRVNLKRKHSIRRTKDHLRVANNRMMREYYRKFGLLETGIIKTG